MKYNRFLPLLIPLLIWGMLELVIFYPAMIYVVMVLAVLLIFFTVWQFTRASVVDRAWWNFFILPALFTIAIIVYSTIQDNRLFLQLLFLIDLVVLYLFLRFSYYYLLNPLSYKVASIENLSLYGNFFIFFLAAASCYGFQAFLDTPIWILMLVLAALSTLVIYQVFWANKIEPKPNLALLLVGTLVLLELAWSISLLPLNYNIAGFTLAIFYYMVVGLLRLELTGGLARDKMKLYLIYGLASIVIILLTARWF